MGTEISVGVRRLALLLLAAALSVTGCDRNPPVSVEIDREGRPEAGDATRP